jgi:U3 small nucleolar RNA-associated protein 19
MLKLMLNSSTLLNTTKHEAAPYLATNLLSILERLTTFPTEPSELNAWWVPEMGNKPPKPKRTSKSDTADTSDEDEDEKNDDDNDDDDWRKFFDEEPVKTDAGKPKPAGTRLHRLTIHQSLHSLASHRAVFTRAWLTLLPRLSIDSEAGKSKILATRALNVMHRGVMPHLTRPVLVMDWVGASVDFGAFDLRFLLISVSYWVRLKLGGTVGLLALNALFVLMKEYNLYVIFSPLAVHCSAHD